MSASGSGAGGEPVRVGLVDTGLDRAVASRVSKALVAARGFAWDDRAETVTQTDSKADPLGHGSALAATVIATAPATQLLMAQVFFGQWRTRPAQVAAAIDWLCACGAQLINLSLGLRADRTVLQQACENALACGVILVASSPAQGEAVFPAAYDGVIRATGDARCQRAQVSWLASAQADVGGCVTAVGGGVAGASAGAAYISGHIARYLQEDREAGRQQVLSHLRRCASFHGPERRGSRPV